MEIKVKSNIKLYDWQSNVVFGLKEHWKGSTHVIKSKRQCGKSTLLAYILIQTAIQNARTTSICLSPRLHQADLIFKAVKRILTPVNAQVRDFVRVNEVYKTITLKNRSQILFKSAEMRDGLRGYTVNGIYVVDEAAFIDDDVFFDTLPWVNVSNAPIIMCSTPMKKSGFFYDYYTRGFQNGNTIYSYDWNTFDTSALLSEEKLEQYRKELPTYKFRTEYLGEFLDNESGVFGDYSHILNNQFTPNLNLYMGIDWGSGVGGDDTAVCIFNSSKQMVAIYHFNDKDETQTINYIIELIKLHKPLKVQVEGNSIGQVFYGLLDKAIKANKLSVQLLKFTTTNESKEKLINNFQVAMQNNNIQILEDNALLTQLDMYEMKLSSTGKKTFNAKPPYHDDMIIAMLLALDCISKGNYKIII